MPRLGYKCAMDHTHVIVFEVGGITASIGKLVKAFYTIRIPKLLYMGGLGSMTFETSKSRNIAALA